MDMKRYFHIFPFVMNAAAPKRDAPAADKLTKLVNLIDSEKPLTRRASKRP